MAEKFPLEWPVGQPRTSEWRRTKSKYRITREKATRELLASVKLLGTLRGSVVLSSNVQYRRDGLPYANSPEPSDPGVALYWTDGDMQPRVIACDTHKKVHENVRAIGLAIDGLRMIKRSGATQIIERAFSGFAALPASTERKKRTWREVLGFSLIADRGWLRAQLADRYRSLARGAHPDTGGSHEAFVELNTAYEEAKKELGL